MWSAYRVPATGLQLRTRPPASRTLHVEPTAASDASSPGARPTLGDKRPDVVRRARPSRPSDTRWPRSGRGDRRSQQGEHPRAGNPVFNRPNRTAEKDFTNWVEERGSKWMASWDPQGQALL